MSQQQWGQPAHPQQPTAQTWNRAGYQSAVQPGWGAAPQQRPAAPPVWGAPSGGGWRPTPAPQPKKKPTLWLVLGGVMLVIVVALMAANAMGGGGGNNDEIAYQNEDYQIPPVAENPPELVIPQNRSDLVPTLGQNPLYQQSVPRPIRCEMSTVDIASASESALEEHLTQLTECLMRVWGKPLEDAGFTPVRFKSNVYTGEITTPCGRIPARNAVFCGANQQMYFGTEILQIIPPELRSEPFMAELIWAHEFGHGVQARNGIFAAGLLTMRDQSPTAAKETGRRMEVQADCFAGLFVGSSAQSLNLTQPDLDNMLKLMDAIGDDNLTGDPNYVGDHGHGASRMYWSQLGMASTSIGVCNTFVAPDEQVR